LVLSFKTATERWYKYDTSLGESLILQAAEIEGTLAWGAFPSIPVAFDLSYGLLDHSEKSWETVDTSGRVTASEWKLGIQGHHTLIGVEFVLRANYVLTGQVEIRDKFFVDGAAKQVEATYQVSGFGFGIGARYKPNISTLSIVAELGLSFQKLTPEKITIDGGSDNRVGPDAGEESYDSISLIGGFQLPLY